MNAAWKHLNIQAEYVGLKTLSKSVTLKARGFG